MDRHAIKGQFVEEGNQRLASGMHRRIGAMQGVAVIKGDNRTRPLPSYISKNRGDTGIAA